MRVKLTKRLVESASQSLTEDTLHWDSEVPGFYLKVTPKGKRIYFVYYRTASGQQRRPKIGDHGPITVDQARDIARQWLAKAAAGTDVSGQRQETRAAGTVADLAERYLVEYAEVHKKPRSIQTDRANIENHVLPLLGSRRVRDVKRQDIQRVRDDVCNGKTARSLTAKPRGRRVIRGGQGIANRVIALLSKMFSCAQEWGLRDDNPVAKVRKYKEQRKDRFLSADEVKRLIQVLDRSELEGATKIVTAIRLLLFTGMRYSEVLTLRWQNVDQEQRCFRLADSKTGTRVIPYGETVAGALACLNVSKPDALLFEGTKADSPLSLRRPWYIMRAAAGIDATATLHTLRHTFASWSVMGGLSLAQVGAVLGHKSTQTTLRYADHAIEALRSYGEQTGAALAALGNLPNTSSSRQPIEQPDQVP